MIEEYPDFVRLHKLSKNKVKEIDESEDEENKIVNFFPYFSESK